MRITNLLKHFSRIFAGEAPSHLACAPGRVNLIGAHSDYNQGLVLPAAVNRYVTMGARPRRDRKVRLYSLHYREMAEFSLDEIERRENPLWVNYPMGVAKVLQENGVLLHGLDALIATTVPIGSGLSSSAALEVASAFAFLKIADFGVVPRDLARICQMAENDFVGMKCGIMDQFSSIYGKMDNLILIDCRSLDYELIPLPRRGIRIVICDTLVKRQLARSSYNRRRQECEEGVRRLKQYLPGVEALRDVSAADLKRYGHHLPQAIRKRCAHVVAEILRTRLAAKRLKTGDLEGFGDLMFASHQSSRGLFEVSCPELDLLVETARRIEGVLGARLTGAGFGGCTVNLVRKEALPEFAGKIRNAYRRAFKKVPGIYVCRPAGGAWVQKIV